MLRLHVCPRQAALPYVTHSPWSKEGGGGAPKPPPHLAPRLAHLYAREKDFVRHVLHGTGVALADLDDLVQDVFLIAWRRITDYDPLAPSRPWLFTIAWRVAANHRRRAYHRHEVSCGEGEARSRLPDPEQNVLEAARNATLRRSLHGLRPGLRWVLVLHDLDGLGVPDIAARLGISIRACFARLTKARHAVVRRRAPGPPARPGGSAGEELMAHART